METEQDIKIKYPLHLAVWKNKVSKLDTLLNDGSCDVEAVDPRGRTPLMLAVTLGRVEAVKLLVQHRANIDVENQDGWTAVQEATAQGNPELLRLVLGKRDYQRHSNRMMGVPALLQKLKEAPDFYVEMKWEFTSWVPLVSRLCPSDTYKIYKQGSNVRIDTTLLGFDQNSWQRGSRSFIFKGESENKAVLLEVNHETRDVYVEELRTEPSALELAGSLTVPSQSAIEARLTTPIVNTFIDVEKISFERNKSGLWGWRSDKLEQINGYDCKVFSATNVHLVTKTRTEHLGDDDKTKVRNHRFPLQSLLSSGNSPEESPTITAFDNTAKNNGTVSLAEYFDASVDLGGRDIGRQKEITSKIQKFKATLWLCENYPLNLVDQIVPIVDLMAMSSSHFAKLKSFIQMQLPAGFPLKIEIPLFHVMSACVTFGNIFGTEESVAGITRVNDGDRVYCVVDDSCFDIPASYVSYGSDGLDHGRRQFSMDEEDGILQYAIQQSLLDSGSEGDQVDIWEALTGNRPSQPNSPSPRPLRAASSLGIPVSAEEEQLQRAIEASLGLGNTDQDLYWTRNATGVDDAEDEALAQAIALSARESEDLQRRALEEEEMLKQILQLSLLEQ